FSPGSLPSPWWVGVVQVPIACLDSVNAVHGNFSSVPSGFYSPVIADSMSTWTYLTPLGIPPHPTPPYVSVGPLPPRNDLEGAPVALPVVANDSAGHPLSYSANSLPPGLFINPMTGLISGMIMPRSAGTYQARVFINDTFGGSTFRAFTWTV